MSGARVTTAKSLRDVCSEIMETDGMREKYPKGLAPLDVINEIEKLYPGGFPLITVIDVADTMRELYGR